MGRNRRKPAGNRKRWPALLIACQGTETEPAYISLLRRHLRAAGITVWSEAKDPATLVRNAVAKAERDDFDEVLVLVDVDDTPDEQLRQAIALTETRKPTRLIVSNECFEVWLLAHFERVDPAWGRQQLADKLAAHGAVSKNNRKHISSDFPVGAFVTASANVKCVPPDTYGPSGSTAANLIAEEFQRRSGRRR